MDFEHLVVGLGNPGPRYVFSPHNAGFEVADRLSALCKGQAFHVQGGALVSECKRRSVSFAVLKPQQFMNLSGEVVVPAARRFALPPERVIVAYDDLDLPLGSFRLREGGGAGGHHGMESLIGCLGTERFPRVRLGIAQPDIPKGDVIDYLLTPMAREKWALIEEAAEKAANAILDSFFIGWPKAMSLYNVRKKKAIEEADEG